MMNVKPAFSKNYLSILLSHILIPILVCTVIGSFIGIIINIDSPRDELFTDISIWIFRINVGAVANMFSFFISYWVFKWDAVNGIRGIWRQIAIGWLFTFLAMLFTNKDVTEPESIIFLGFSVFIITIIVYVFLFQVGFFSRLSMSLSSVDDYLTLKDNENIEKVNTKWVSYIKVEDHYCTVVYRKENTWEEWTVYEKLKNFEEKHKESFIRVNRSTLVNPLWVDKIEKKKGKYSIVMKSQKSASFSLSSAQQPFLEKLIPIIK